jgi:hypothetical protein
MKRLHLSDPEADLTPIFGAIEPDTMDEILAEFRQVGESMASLNEEFSQAGGSNWVFDGVRLDVYPAGASEITAYMEDDELSFIVELRRSGESSWEAGARVLIEGDGKGNDAQDVAAEITQVSTRSALEAARSYRLVASELVSIARQRPPTRDSWRSSI